MSSESERKEFWDVNSLCRQAPDWSKECILFPGSAARDLSVLIPVAESIQQPIFIVSDLKLSSPHPLLIYKSTLPFYEYLAAIGNARLILVPMTETIRAVGQTTIAYALRTQTPVVASYVPAVWHLLDNGLYGYIAPPGSTQQFILAVNECLRRHPNQLLLQNARKHEHDLYQKDKNTFQLIFNTLNSCL